jgi:hypothetical protein
MQMYSLAYLEARSRGLGTAEIVRAGCHWSATF